METIREIWQFLRERKKFWLAPIIIVLMLLGLLIAVGSASPVLAPFIYAM